MHELGIVFYIIKDVKEAAMENLPCHVSKVVLNIGEVSTVIPDYLSDCWKWASAKEEIMKDARLEICTIKAINHCNDCGADYPAMDHGRTCPHCGSGNTVLLQGNEVEIKEIEIIE